MKKKQNCNDRIKQLHFAGNYSLFFFSFLPNTSDVFSMVGCSRFHYRRRMAVQRCLTRNWLCGAACGWPIALHSFDSAVELLSP